MEEEKRGSVRDDRMPPGPNPTNIEGVTGAVVTPVARGLLSRVRRRRGIWCAVGGCEPLGKALDSFHRPAPAEPAPGAQLDILGVVADGELLQETPSEPFGGRQSTRGRGRGGVT
jgi:hypothetical protein